MTITTIDPDFLVKFPTQGSVSVNSAAVEPPPQFGAKPEPPGYKYVERAVKALDELFNEPNRIAKMLDGMYAQPSAREIGFVLIVFPLTGSGPTKLASTASRADLIKLLREQLAAVERDDAAAR